MAYTRLTAARNGVDSILYAKCGSAHNGRGNRHDYISVINLLPDNVVPIERQMASYFARASAMNLTQTRRLIQSFSANELDPTSQHDIQLANHIGRETVKQLWPDFPSAIFTQTDGVHGLIHNHIIVCNVNALNFRGMTNTEANYWAARRMSDAICGQYFELDRVQQARDKTSRYARVAREKNNAEKQSGTSTEYIWTDDLKSRILDAARASMNMDEFADELQARGVAMVFHTPKRDTAKERHPDGYLTYELFTPSKKVSEKRALKARSYKLGSDYDVASLRKTFDYNVRNPEFTSERKLAKNSIAGARGSHARPDTAPRPAPKRKASHTASAQCAVPSTPPTADKASAEAAQRRGEDANAAASAVAQPGHGYASAEGMPPAADRTGRERPAYEAEALRIFGDEYRRLTGTSDVQQTADAFDGFRLWRPARSKQNAANGRAKLQAIYSKDKTTGAVRINVDEVRAQCRLYCMDMRLIGNDDEATMEPSQDASQENSDATSKPNAADAYAIDAGMGEADTEPERVRPSYEQAALAVFERVVREKYPRVNDADMGRIFDAFRSWRGKASSANRAMGKPPLAKIYDKDKATGRVAIVEGAMREQFALYDQARRSQQAARAQATTAQGRINQARGLMPNEQQHDANRPKSRGDHQPGG